MVLTDNRRSMASVRRWAGGGVELRLQRLFLDAPPEVLAELGDFLAERSRSSQAMRDFVRRRFREKDVPRSPAGPAKMATRGNHHDLAAMAERLNTAYLGGRSRAGVTWGRRARAGRGRSIRFGCYDPARNLIIMNRKLDSAEMPAYFVEYILFHEMLHEVLGMDSRPDGRRSIHGRLFKLMESTYPDYEKALAYEKGLCRRLETL
ncbi:MAG: M48 family metallopeptidase [Planctomycetota bacterium]|nr:M48 family metallopeptidase [Planctomycetota bacterium]